MWAKRVGVGWLAYELTHSVFWVGVIAAADLLPTLFCGPWAGSLGDRHNRLVIIRWAQTVSIAATVALFLALLSDGLSFELLFVIVVIDGMAMAVKQPSRMALVRALVPRDTLGAAIALNAITFNLARFVGPALAGFLIIAVDVSGVFLASTIGSVMLLWVSFLVHPSFDPPVARPAQTTGLLNEFLDAGRWAFAQPLVAPVLLIATSASVLLRGFIELLPGFAAQVMERGAEGLAAATSAIGIGAIVGGLWLGQRQDQDHLFRIVGSGAIASSIILIAIVTDLPFILSLLALAALGLFLIVAGVGAQTLIQSQTPEDRLSRVLSLYGIILRAGPAVGALIMGATTDMFGFQAPFMLTAGLCIVLVLYLLLSTDDRMSVSFSKEPSPRA